MLGRLQMDIEECITAYSELSRSIFSKNGLPVNFRGNIKGRYKASELENAIKKITTNLGSSEDALLDDGEDRGCRVYVTELKEPDRKANIQQIRVRSQKGEQRCGPSSRLSF